MWGVPGYEGGGGDGRTMVARQQKERGTTVWRAGLEGEDVGVPQSNRGLALLPARSDD